MCVLAKGATGTLLPMCNTAADCSSRDRLNEIIIFCGIHDGWECGEILVLIRIGIV